MANLKWSNDDHSTLEFTDDGAFVPGSVVSGMESLELPRRKDDFAFFGGFGELLIESGDVLTPFEALMIKLGAAPSTWTELVPWSDNSAPSQGVLWRIIQERIVARGALRRFRQPGRVFWDMDLGTSATRTSETNDFEGDVPQWADGLRQRMARALMSSANRQVDSILTRIDAAFAQYGSVLAEGHENLKSKYLAYNTGDATSYIDNSVYSIKSDGRFSPVMDTLHMCNSAQIITPTTPPTWRVDVAGADSTLPDFYPHTRTPNMVEGTFSQATCDVIRKIRALILRDASISSSFASAEGIRGIFNTASSNEKLALMNVWYPWVNGPAQFGETRSLRRGIKLSSRSYCTREDFGYTLLLLHAANFTSGIRYTGQRVWDVTQGAWIDESVPTVIPANLIPYTVRYLEWVQAKCMRALGGVASWWGQGMFDITPGGQSYLPISRETTGPIRLPLLPINRGRIDLSTLRDFNGAPLDISEDTDVEPEVGGKEQELGTEPTETKAVFKITPKHIAIGSAVIIAGVISTALIVKNKRAKQLGT